MRVEQEISVHLIDIDRIPLDKKTLGFANALAGISSCGLVKAKFPAIKVAKLRYGRYEIRDGRHRWAAHKLLGQKKILAKFSLRVLKNETRKNA